MKDPDSTISRRNFLGKGIATVVGAGLGIAGATQGLKAKTPVVQLAQAESGTKDKPQIKDYRKLGRTGWKVSDIAFGNARMTDPAMLEYAMERGINYVDTARQYFDMEVVIGKIFPEKRDKLFVATKLEPELITAEVSVQEVTKAIEESLERLNTDYIDCCMIHSVGDPNLGDRTRIENRNTYEAFEKAKKAGKIRAWGASSHGPRLVEDFSWLIENTGIDMIMPGMNYMTKGLEPVLAKAREKDIAVVAMKSLSAARKIDYSAFIKDGRTIRQALLRWMLAQPNIDTISLTMSTFEDVDEFVGASGTPKLTPDEKKALEKYGMLLDSDYCRPGCGACLANCPQGVPINDILRYRLYFHNYGREKDAMGLYAALPASKNAHQCQYCSAPCTGSCPFGISIKHKLVEAHTELTV
ncbi:MAG: aldo/keto reductase [Candidatus Latescibacterota bacterium]|nr:MAG: aldo/keto reductase [Candidatus Latescibacterota bacterium]